MTGHWMSHGLAGYRIPCSYGSVVTSGDEQDLPGPPWNGRRGDHSVGMTDQGVPDRQARDQVPDLHGSVRIAGGEQDPAIRQRDRRDRCHLGDKTMQLADGSLRPWIPKGQPADGRADRQENTSVRHPQRSQFVRGDGETPAGLLIEDRFPYPDAIVSGSGDQDLSVAQRHRNERPYLGEVPGQGWPDRVT